MYNFVGAGNINLISYFYLDLKIEKKNKIALRMVDCTKSKFNAKSDLLEGVQL